MGEKNLNDEEIEKRLGTIEREMLIEAVKGKKPSMYLLRLLTKWTGFLADAAKRNASEDEYVMAALIMAAEIAQAGNIGGAILNAKRPGTGQEAN